MLQGVVSAPSKVTYEKSTHAATRTPNSRLMTAKSIRCRVVMYVVRSRGSRPAIARTRLMNDGFRCPAARVGGVGGASWTRRTQGAEAL